MINKYHGSSLGAFEAHGNKMSFQEKEYDHDHQLTFKETVEKLKQGAKELIKNKRRVDFIKALLDKYGSVEAFTLETCQQIADEHPDFDLQPEMIRALAEELENERREQH